MADNPFDIDALLNSVNFDGDELQQVFTGSANFDADNGGLTYTPSALLSQTSNPGAITVVNNEYVAARLGDEYTYYYYDLQKYYIPTFGALQFKGLVDGSGNPITYWVHGFTENGLWLSTERDLFMQSKSADTSILNPAGGTADIFLFGTYGVSAFEEAGNPNDVHIPGATFNSDATLFCFAEDTLIATADGPVAVQELAVGAMVVTASGERRPVKWIGRLVAHPSRHPRPQEVNPVCVRAHAFGPDMPMRDLRVSPGHAIYVDGVLVPAGELVNDATIFQEEVEHVRYFHIELDSHDVLLAEGLPCESYLDDGNRASAVNATEFVQLYGRLDPKSWDDACAPLVAGGPQLVAIQQRLNARAEALGWVLCDVADLKIEADGVTILPECDADNRFRFRVPAAERLVLRTASGVLAHVMPGVSDRRRLGVAVSRLSIDGAMVALDAELFGEGFHPVELHGEQGWRWTNGAAMLTIASPVAVLVEVELAMVAPSWRRPAASFRIAA